MSGVADSSVSPGREVAISWRGARGRAWVPAPVSARQLGTTPTTARRVGEALALIRATSAALASPWEPAARLLLRAEGVASSAIEGLRAPLAEVAAAELDALAVAPASAWVADNLAVVTEALDGAPLAPLSVEVLDGWHRRLMRNSGIDERMIGAFRDAQGWIGGTSPLDAVYVPPPPEFVSDLMDDLVEFANGDAHDAVTQAAAVHAQFETIHPYGDGNGRLGRVLVGWVLCRRLRIAVPPPLSLLIARDAGGYLSALYEFRTGEVDRFLTWFASVLLRSAEATSAVISSVEALRADWTARMHGLRADALAHRLLDLIPVHPVISSGVVVRETKVSARTARRALADLAARGILQPFTPDRRSAGRPYQWWVAADLLDAVGGW